MLSARATHPGVGRAFLLVAAVTASVTLLLTSCVEDLPDAPYRPHEYAGLTAHPEYQFLWKLGASQPLPYHGYPALGRRITEMDQLIQVAHFITHQGCPSPQDLPPAQLGPYFTPGMFETFSAAVVCDHGSGDVIALMKPGQEARFESAYRTVPDVYKTRWQQAAQDTGEDCCGGGPDEKVDYWGYHPIGVGNGFVVFKVIDAAGHSGDDAWSYAGLARLVCSEGKRPEGKYLPLDLRDAASPGCYLAVGHR